MSELNCLDDAKSLNIYWRVQTNAVFNWIKWQYSTFWLVSFDIISKKWFDLFISNFWTFLKLKSGFHIWCFLAHLFLCPSHETITWLSDACSKEDEDYQGQHLKIFTQEWPMRAYSLNYWLCSLKTSGIYLLQGSYSLKTIIIYLWKAEQIVFKSRISWKCLLNNLSAKVFRKMFKKQILFILFQWIECK